MRPRIYPFPTMNIGESFKVKPKGKDASKVVGNIKTCARAMTCKVDVARDYKYPNETITVTLVERLKSFDIEIDGATYPCKAPDFETAFYRVGLRHAYEMKSHA